MTKYHYYVQIHLYSYALQFISVINCTQPWKIMKEVKLISFLITRIGLVMENLLRIIWIAKDFWLFLECKEWGQQEPVC